MPSRLDRLFALLEAGTTFVTRKAAAEQLGELVRLHSPDLDILLDRLHNYIISKTWDTRIAAGCAVRAIVENHTRWNPVPVSSEIDSNDLNSKLESLSLSSFDIKNVLKNGSHLSGGNEAQFQVDQSPSTAGNLAQQRDSVNKTLGLDIAQGLGLNTEDIFSNSDLCTFDEGENDNEKESALNLVSQEINRGCRRDSFKRRLPSDNEELLRIKKIKSEESPLLIDETVCDSIGQDVWPFQKFCDILVQDLFNSNWETRHGAAIALREIVSVQGRVAGRKSGKSMAQMDSDNQLWLEDKAVRSLSVIAMDRFVDFVCDDAVAPVRESCSQLLGSIVKFMSDSSVKQLQVMIHEMQQWEDWGTRHGGMLALKYIMGVREDLKKTLFMDSYQYIFEGLSDSVDDVIAEAACCFLPLSEELSLILDENQLNILLTILWKSLLEFDGISGALKSILGLISNIYDHSEITDKMTLDSSSYVERLWPFMYDTSSKMRAAALKTILSLLKGKFVQSESYSSRLWLHDLIDSLTVHVFQSLIIENDLNNLEMAVQIWDNILTHSPPIRVQEISIKYFATWMTLLASHPRATLDMNLFKVPSLETHLKKSKLSEDKCSSQSKKYILGSGFTVTTNEKDQMKLCLRAKIYGAKLLGNLSHYAVQVNGLVYPSGETPLECFQRMLIGYLTSQSAWVRHLVALVLREWAVYHSINCLPLKNDLCKALSELVYYDEVAWNCARLQRQTKDFIAVLNVYNLDVGVPYKDLNIFTLEQIHKLTNDIAKDLLSTSKLRKKCLDQLEERREELISIANEVTKDHNSYTLLVQSSLACAMVAMNMLPEKLTPLVKPLMDSIRKEENEAVQDMSALYLPQLMQKCASREACPNLKIFKNLCTFLCVDETVTPVVGDNEIPASSGIYNLSMQKEKANKIGSRCSSITGRPVGRPRNNVNDASDITASTNTELQKSKKIQRQGCTKALINIVKYFGPRLKNELSFFHDSLINPLKGDPTTKVETAADVQATIQWFQLLEIIIPHLPSDLLNELVDYIHSFCMFLFHKFCVIRHMASRVFAILTRERMDPCMIRLVDNILPNLDAPPTETCIMMKEGVLEFIYYTIERLELKILPFLVLLIVPLLARMSDSRMSIRQMATQCFAILIQLYPLESSANNYELMPSHLVEKKIEKRIFLDQLADPSKLNNFVIPIEINAVLRPYQQKGVNWLAFLNQYNLHGILCDDMGLGKTLQSICILAADHHNKRNSLIYDSLTQIKSLIICPSTLTSHWYYELKKFVSSKILNPIDYSGLPYERKRLREQIHHHDVVIASYKIVRNELDEFFSKYKWNYVILDEGHIIKNGKTKSSIAIKSLEANHRLILSGTPIQNNVLDLWSLFDFLMPGYLGSERQFNATFSRPILQSREAKASLREQEAGVLAMEKLHRQTLPFLLRRIKEDVLKDLPPKITQDYYCELSQLQKDLYEDFSKVPSCNENLTRATKQNQSYIFQALQYLKRVCNHPKLAITPSHPKYYEIMAELKKNNSSLSDIQYSTKMLALKQLLMDCGIGNCEDGSSNFSVLKSIVSPHRALVFCQLKGMIDIIEKDLLKTHLPSVTYLRLDGTIPANMRHGIVQRFNSDPSIDLLLLTTHVGGLGLNLTGADTVIFVEHDWNPMRDLQAMDRAHRIGQKRIVNVYRLITKRTIEEKIMNLQKFKLMTARTVINDDNASLVSMGTDQLLDLFTMDHGEVVNKKEDAAANQKYNSINDVIANLPDLWDDDQYSDEYDFDSFLKKLNK